MNNLTIGDFEGPLDLLLHLIKLQKKDIFDVNLIEITDLYLDFIKSQKDINLDVSSEYLVVSSELILIKSRSLLPLKEDDEEDIVETENELKERLIEYQKYKDTKSIFEELAKNRSLYYTKSPERSEIYTAQFEENDGTLVADDLLLALQKLLERQNYQKPISTKITKKELSINDRIDTIRVLFKKDKIVSFVSLFESYDKPMIVVTFLSILQMAKDGEIIIKQSDNFEDINLERVD